MHSTAVRLLKISIAAAKGMQRAFLIHRRRKSLSVMPFSLPSLSIHFQGHRLASMGRAAAGLAQSRSLLSTVDPSPEVLSRARSATFRLSDSSRDPPKGPDFNSGRPRKAFVGGVVGESGWSDPPHFATIRGKPPCLESRGCPPRGHGL
jgi:hypothetical protein